MPKLTGYPPTVVTTNDTTVSIPTGGLTLTGYPPTVTAEKIAQAVVEIVQDSGISDAAEMRITRFIEQDVPQMLPEEQRDIYLGALKQIREVVTTEEFQWLVDSIGAFQVLKPLLS